MHKCRSIFKCFGQCPYVLRPIFALMYFFRFIILKIYWWFLVSFFKGFMKTFKIKIFRYLGLYVRHWHLKSGAGLPIFHQHEDNLFWKIATQEVSVPKPLNILIMYQEFKVQLPYNAVKKNWYEIIALAWIIESIFF